MVVGCWALGQLPKPWLLAGLPDEAVLRPGLVEASLARLPLIQRAYSYENSCSYNYK